MLRDDSIGNAEEGKSVYRTYGYDLIGNGAKGLGDGLMSDSLTPRPADPAWETVLK